MNPFLAGLRFFLIVAGLFAANSAPAAVSIVKTNYHGWSNCYLLSNGEAEVVVVPAIGRVMQFRFAGEKDGPFWENRATDGKSGIPEAREWVNFGGDKTWPAPQSDWPRITPRSWPPPVGFDAVANEARIEGDRLRLISPVDLNYGIRHERVIALDATEPKMMIETTYYKVQGEPSKVSIWIITQLGEPEDVCARITTEKFVKQSKDEPMGLRFDKAGLHLKRSPTRNTKIGTDASILEWRNRKWSLQIESKRIAGAEYPDDGSSAEIYTNMNPLTYVELEMLGPLKTLKTGDSAWQVNTYTLGKISE